MANNLGKALGGMSKPGKTARPKATASMTIDPMPKTSFTDKNLDPKMSPAGPEKVTSGPAKSGGSISPNPNAPKQTSTLQKSPISKT